jgi:hypothetical protein
MPVLEQVKQALKPRFTFGKTSKKPFKPKATKTYRLPKLIIIGNSVGFVIGSRLLRSMDWRIGDKIRYEYDDSEKVLKVRNFTAEEREYNAVHEEH